MLICFNSYDVLPPSALFSVGSFEAGTLAERKDI